MTYIPKPKVQHPASQLNSIGLSRRDYEGGLSTLCAGCGHDSVTSAIVQAFFELAIPPHQVAKTSGIGCSSKTPGYFLSQAHGFNSVHGRMPSVTTGAYAAHHGLSYIGVSGDGDTGSIGIGQYIHAIRRQINMLYIIENNGVYGLTKGQFSATADRGSRLKSGLENPMTPIDPAALALHLGAGFVARGFSGDKQQLVPLLKAAIMYPGFALVDVISPCVAFNNHAGSTRSYDATRSTSSPAYGIADLFPPKDSVKGEKIAGGGLMVDLGSHGQLHLDDSQVDYPLGDSAAAMAHLQQQKKLGNITTGLLHLNSEVVSMQQMMRLPQTPLRDTPFTELCPGKDALKALMANCS